MSEQLLHLPGTVTLRCQWLREELYVEIFPPFCQRCRSKLPRRCHCGRFTARPRGLWNHELLRAPFSSPELALQPAGAAVRVVRVPGGVQSPAGQPRPGHSPKQCHSWGGEQERA